MKLHEAKLLLNDPTFSIDSITYQELEMDSDYVDVHEDISYSKDNVDLHSHTFFEILFCQSGSLQYMVGNTRYQLVKNSIVCIPPGVSHCPLYLEQLSEPYRRTVMWISNKIYHQYMNLLNNDPIEKSSCLLPQNVFLLSGNILYQVEELYEKMLNIPPDFSGAELYKIGLSAQIVTLFHQFLNSHEINPLKPEKTILLDEIIHFIENHLSEELSAKRIAAHFLVSESSINQLFSKQISLSLYRYITQRRLIEAKNLISSQTPLKNCLNYVDFLIIPFFTKLLQNNMVFLQKNIKTEFLKCSNEKAPGWGKNLIFPAGGFLLVLLYSFPITVSSTALLSLLQIQVFQGVRTYFSYSSQLPAD